MRKKIQEKKVKENFILDYITAKTVASHDENSNTGEASSPSALFTKFGGSFFGGATGSPQKVVTNIRGFLSNRLHSNISIPSVPDTGKLAVTALPFYVPLTFTMYIKNSFIMKIYSFHFIFFSSNAILINI